MQAMGGLPMNTWVDTWFRFSRNPACERNAKEPMYWLCYPNRRPPALTLRTWHVDRTLALVRIIQGRDPTGENPLGLKAWFDLYGDGQVIDHVLRVVLKHPP
jgi:hypothetical protein